MKTANIGELKDNLSKFIALVEQGEAIEVCKRNIPIARIIPYNAAPTKNRTRLGCGLGSVKILSDLTEPLIPEGTWDMYRP
jgi:prevent-host-death family protein